MKALFIFIFMLSLFFVSATKTSALVSCTTQYGGGENCVTTGQLLLDKKVWNTTSGSYVDNLGLADHLFSAGEEVVFQISVKNTGDATFSKIAVNDTLPNFLTLTSGSLNYEIDNLAPGQTDTRQIHTKVVAASSLPNQATMCLVNTAQATSNDNQTDRDTAQFCLQNKVLGVTTLPPAGPEDLIFFLIAGTLSAIGGLYFLKNRPNLWEGVKE